MLSSLSTRKTGIHWTATSHLRINGNLGRIRYIFHSQKLEEEALVRYRKRAERDWERMVELKGALNKGRKPRKKYRISNWFVDTYLSYRFPLRFSCKEGAVEHAVRSMIGGRGAFRAANEQGVVSFRDLGAVPVQECGGGRIPGPEAWHLLEASQVHLHRCDQGTYTRVVPRPLLPIHGPFPVPGVQKKDRRIIGGGSELVLTYGREVERRIEKAVL